MSGLTHRLCVAPMMDWTDGMPVFLRPRHAPCVALHRNGDDRACCMATCRGTLEFDPSEHPVACSQLGASDPRRSRGARGSVKTVVTTRFNLNVGCPSERVQIRQLRRLLMAEPALVAIAAAMRTAVRFRSRSKQSDRARFATRTTA